VTQPQSRVGRDGTLSIDDLRDTVDRDGKLTRQFSRAHTEFL
jgi:hypothetical protein